MTTVHVVNCSKCGMPCYQKVGSSDDPICETCGGGSPAQRKPKGKAFVSGPYSGSSDAHIQANISKTRLVVEEVIRAGWIPICPNVQLSPFADLQSYDYWLEASFILLECCNILVLSPGWKISSGTVKEVKRAFELHMPVFESVDQLKVYEANLIGIP